MDFIINKICEDDLRVAAINEILQNVIINTYIYTVHTTSAPRSASRLSRLPVGLLPPLNVLLLALLTPGKVFWILGLLHGVPVVQYPVRGDHLSPMGNTTGRVGDCGDEEFKHEISVYVR